MPVGVLCGLDEFSQVIPGAVEETHVGAALGEERRSQSPVASEADSIAEVEGGGPGRPCHGDLEGCRAGSCVRPSRLSFQEPRASRVSWLSHVVLDQDEEGEEPDVCDGTNMQKQSTFAEVIPRRSWFAAVASLEPLWASLQVAAEGQLSAGVMLGMVWLLCRLQQRQVMLPLLSGTHLLLSLFAATAVNYDPNLYSLRDYCLRYGLLATVLMAVNVGSFVGFQNSDAASGKADMWICIVSCCVSVVSVSWMGQHMLLSHPVILGKLAAKGLKVNVLRRFAVIAKMVLMNLPVLLAMAFVVVILEVRRLLLNSQSPFVYTAVVLGAFCIKCLLSTLAKYTVSLIRNAHMVHVELTLSFTELITTLGLRFIMTATDQLGFVILAAQLSSLSELLMCLVSMAYYRNSKSLKDDGADDVLPVADMQRQGSAVSEKPNRSKLRRQEIAFRLWTAATVDTFVRARAEHTGLSVAVAFAAAVGQHPLFEVGGHTSSSSVLMSLAVQVIPEVFVDALSIVILRKYGWSQKQRGGDHYNAGSVSAQKLVARLLVGPMVAPLLLQASLRRGG